MLKTQQAPLTVAVLIPYPGKTTYQNVYDIIIETVESAGHQVRSPEKSRQYQVEISADNTLRGQEKAHYEYIRRSVIEADAVIVEASWEDFRIGHEATLAMLYHKPVLGLSQLLNLDAYVHYPTFTGAQYEPVELPGIINAFLNGVSTRRPLNTTQTDPGAWQPTDAKTILVVGGVYADIFNQVETIPGADDVVYSQDFMVLPGGKATNAAVAFARQGERVYLCGSVGCDYFGDGVEASLIREGIHTDFVYHHDSDSTGTVTLAVNNKAKYTTIVNESAAVQVPRDFVMDIFHHIDEGRLTVDALYLTLELSPEIVELVIRQAHQRKILLYCDPAPHLRPLDAALLPLIDVVAPNEVEAHAMTGESCHDQASLKRAARTLLDAGAPRVVITAQDRGSYYTDPNFATWSAAIPVDGIDESSAGDAFRATMLREMLRDDPADSQQQNRRRQLHRASAAGAYAVTHFGSYHSMPTTYELEQFISRHRPHQTPTRSKGLQ